MVQVRERAEGRGAPRGAPGAREVRRTTSARVNDRPTSPCSATRTSCTWATRTSRLPRRGGSASAWASRPMRRPRSMRPTPTTSAWARSTRRRRRRAGRPSGSARRVRGEARAAAVVRDRRDRRAHRAGCGGGRRKATLDPPRDRRRTGSGARRARDPRRAHGPLGRLPQRHLLRPRLRVRDAVERPRGRDSEGRDHAEREHDHPAPPVRLPDEPGHIAASVAAV